MGAPITEFYVEQIIRTGLEQLRNRPSKIEEIFENLNEGVFVNTYGKKVIDQIRDFVLNRKIAVINNHNVLPQHIPCYSIQMGSSFEDHAKAFLDDYAYSEMEDIELNDRDIITTLVIDSYDAETGLCSVADDVDLSSLYVGAVVVDSAREVFEIVGPFVDSDNRRGFYIVNDANITVGTVSIVSQIDETKTGRREAGLIDKVEVGIWSVENTNMTKYLYYLLIYWLFSRRLELETAGYQISKYTANDLTKNVELLPDNVTVRMVNIEFTTWFRWNDDPWTAYTNFRPRFNVEKVIYEKDDGTDVGTTEDEE